MTGGAVRIRQAQPGDAAVVRAVRLAALADAPAAFGSNLAREQAYATSDWRAFLDRHSAVFLAEDTDGSAKGMVGAHPDDHDPGRAWLVAMWVHPEYRGSGVADALVRAVIDRAAQSGLQVSLRCMADNERALRFYRRLGFQVTGASLEAPSGEARLCLEHTA